MSIFIHPTGRGTRTQDKWGSGIFAAQRDGGKRHHMGLDLIVEPGQPILCPCDGIVTMHGIAYADDPRFRTLRIQPDDEDSMEIRMLYVLPEALIGSHHQAGDRIATAQDISLRYEGITPHVHLEVRRQGMPTDPAPFLVDA